MEEYIKHLYELLEQMDQIETPEQYRTLAIKFGKMRDNQLKGLENKLNVFQKDSYETLKDRISRYSGIVFLTPKIKENNKLLAIRMLNLINSLKGETKDKDVIWY